MFIKAGLWIFWLILWPAKVMEAMDLSHFFHPLGQQAFNWAQNAQPSQTGGRLLQHTSGHHPPIKSGDVVLVGVKTSPKDDAPDWIRYHLYPLKAEQEQARMVDAGDLHWDGHDPAGIANARDAFEQLLGSGACVVVMGAGQELTVPQFEAMASDNGSPRLVVVDALADLGKAEQAPLHYYNFLSHILSDQGGDYPGDVSLLAYQYPLVSNEALDRLNASHFELCRLSEMRTHFESVEPAIRAGHLLSFDVGSIRQADAPGTHHPLPSGLHAEEACRLAKLAGLSPALQCLGFYEFNPAFDQHGQTANLIAQAIWYFLEGYAERYQEHPLLDEEAFYKYITAVSANAYQLVFFKSKKTGRWWMALPSDTDSDTYGPIVPCTYEDYLAAGQNHLPDRWLRNLQQHW